MSVKNEAGNNNTRIRQVLRYVRYAEYALHRVMNRLSSRRHLRMDES
jgi:hypothetical protein